MTMNYDGHNLVETKTKQKNIWTNLSKLKSSIFKSSIAPNILPLCANSYCFANQLM